MESSTTGAQPETNPHHAVRSGGGAISWTAAGGVLLLAAATLAAVPISSTVETSCGSLLGPTFEAPWDTKDSCGIAHLGTAAVVAALLLTGCALIILAGLLGRRTPSPRAAWLLTMVVAIIATIATGVLAWRAETLPDPVLRRGWVSVRDISGVAALGLFVVARVAKTVDLSGRDSTR